MTTHTLPPEMKPCPFCNAEAFIAPGDNGGWLTGCTSSHDNCAVQPSVGADTRAEAIAAWNRRAKPSGARAAPPEVKVLLDWLDKRGLPDSGIRYEAGSHANTRGIRHSLSHVQLHGADADFIAKHFHGEGARNLAVALRSALEPSGEGVGAEPRLLEQLYGDRPPSTKQTYRDAAMRMIEDATLPGTGDMTYPTVRDLDLAEAFASAIEAAALYAQPLSGMEGVEAALRDFDVQSWIDDYEFRGDEGDYRPNPQERELLIDAAEGLRYDITQAVRAALSTPVSAASPEGERANGD